MGQPPATGPGPGPQPGRDPGLPGGRVPGGGVPGGDVPGARRPARPLRLADFAQGHPGDTCPPGPGLAQVLDRLSGPARRCGPATDDELIGLLGRWAALESWAAAAKLGAAAELIRRRARPGHENRAPAGLPDAWDEGLGHEIAAALALSLPGADKLAALAWTLQARLPRIGAKLADGTISALKAQIIADELAVLDDEHAAMAEALIADQLAGLSPGQIGKLAATAAAEVDPEGARKRREQAERDDARVRFWREASGASALAGYGLPTDAALAANANIGLRARQYKTAKVSPGASMDQLRVLAFLDILNGIPAATRIAQARAEQQAQAGEAAAGQHRLAAPDDAGCGPGGSTPGGDPVDGWDPDDGSRDDMDSDGDRTGEDRDADSAGGESGDDQPGAGSCPDHGPGGGESGDDHPGAGSCPDHGPGGGESGDDRSVAGPGDGPGPCDGPGADAGDNPGAGDNRGGSGSGGGCGCGGGPGAAPGAGDAGPALAASTNLTIPLATLQQLAERPGHAHGLGPLDPALARDLAAAAARSPHSAWCLTITSPDGYAIGHGCARPSRRTRGKAPPGSRAGPWTFTRHDDHPGPAGGYGTWTLTLPDGRQLDVSLVSVPVTGCDHRYESPGYQPGDLLRHLVQVRDGECTFPCCSRHARESDFEHAIPYDQGGRTCACNAGARSRRCHQVKQSKGWTVTQPRPGWHQWTTPSGRTYTQGPKQYPA